MDNRKPVITKIFTALGAIALAASLAFSGVTYLSKRSLEVQNKQQADKLTKLDAQVKTLDKQYRDDETKLASLSDQLAKLLPENSSLKDNVGAFAEQAAACEKIRQTLKLGV